MKHYIIYTTRLIHTGTQTSGSSSIIWNSGSEPFLYHASLKYLSFVSNLPGYKSVVKGNVLFGKFIDQTFNVVQHLRAHTPLEVKIYW